MNTYIIYATWKSHSRRDGAGPMMLLNETRGEGGEGNPHAAGEPLSLGQS